MSYDSIFDLDNITLQGCQSMTNEGYYALINDGHIVDFEKGEKNNE